MTEDRLKFIERYCIPTRHSKYYNYYVEILKEVRRARRSEKVCRAAAQIYKARLEPVKLVMRKSA